MHPAVRSDRHRWPALPVRLAPDDRELLERIAAARGVSMTEAIATMVRLAGKVADPATRKTEAA
jgi:uncharacterized protein (DUF1778 family)